MRRCKEKGHQRYDAYAERCEEDTNGQRKGSLRLNSVAALGLKLYM